MGSHGKEEDSISELEQNFRKRQIADAIFPYDSSRYVIFGVPFDGTSSFRRGSRLAPDSVRLAYKNLESFDPGYDINFTDIPICDLGDLEESENVQEVLDIVETSVSTMRKDGKIPIMLGGEHSITVGALRNYKDCNLVIIDAHSDFRDEYMGSRFNHACVTRRALDILGSEKISSLGTRSISMEEYRSSDFGRVRFYTAEEIRNRGIKEISDEIASHTGDRVYFSIDIDGIDPAYAPAAGTPEPYGLTPWEVRFLLRRIAKKVIAYDIVEFSPLYDNGNTAMLAAKLIQDFIGSRETEKF